MPSRVIAIGDVHGCAIALDALLRQIEPRADDTIVMLGDCVDRGPDSRGVIGQLLNWKDRCRLVPILGNHEEMMLNHLEGRAQPDNWLLCGGQETLNSYRGTKGQPSVPPAHLEFIRSWGDYWEADDQFFVHGAYHPEQLLGAQRWQTWRWHSLRDMLPGPHVSGKTAVVGHTAQKSGEILDVGHLVCIDTYCWGGGRLTGYEPTSGQVWQVDRDGNRRN